MTLPRKLLAVTGALLLALAVAFGARQLLLDDGPVASALPKVGGPFTLTGHDGRPVSATDFAGRYMLVYFGYTYCPDVCPTGLQNMAAALDRLPPEQADRIVPLFITFDPERDTPAQLAGYVASFHPRLIGLTGTPDQIAAVAKAYRAFYAKVPAQDGSYTVDHSSILYLMGPDGSFLQHFTHQNSPEQIAEALRKRVK